MDNELIWRIGNVIKNGKDRSPEDTKFLQCAMIKVRGGWPLSETEMARLDSLDTEKSESDTAALPTVAE